MNSNIELSSYIRESLKNGQTKESIIDSLLAAGWQKSVIDGEFFAIEDAGGSKNMPVSSPNQSLLEINQSASSQARSAIDQKMQEKKPLSNKLITTIAIIGSVLVGTGVILLIASNWEEISRFGKVAIIFLIILANYTASYYLLFVKNYQKTGRALIFLGSILFGAGIILIAQIFNIEFESGSMLLVWSLLVLPLAFIFKLGSSLALSAALFFLWGVYKTFGGLPIISGLSGGGRPFMAVPEINYWYLILLLFIFIPLTYYIRSLKIQALNIIALGVWITTAIGINFAQTLMEMESKQQRFTADPSSAIAMLMLVIIYSIAVYFIGKAHLTYEYWKKFSLSYVGPAILSIFGTSFVLSFKGLLRGMSYVENEFAKRTDNISVLKIETTPYFMFFYVILILFAVVAAYISYSRKQIKTKSDIPEIASLFFLILLSIVFTYLVSINKDTINLFVIVFNLILFLGSLGLIFVGHIQREKAFINIGLLFFAVGIIARYFDWAYALMDRSLFFIFGGIILIALSIFIERQRRKLLQDIA